MEHPIHDEPPRILVVDDEKVIREILADFLSMEGFWVRTAEDGPVARAVAEPGVAVGFEVDHLDDAHREGWSVMLRGTARRVVEGAELADVRELGIDPWAGNERDVYVRVATTEVTGRRIRTRR